MDREHLTLCGVGLRVVGGHASERARLGRIWRRYFAVHAGARPAGRELTVRLVAPHGDGEPAARQLVERSGPLAVWREGSGFVLTCGATTVRIGAGGAIVIAAGPDLEALAPRDQRELFLLAFLMALRTFERYGLHANGISDGATGFLVVGRSGSGKTTLATALVRRGWRFLADDALVLHRIAGDLVEALPLRRGVSCTPQTLTRFPELGRVADAETLDGEKRLVELADAYPGCALARALPSVVLFTSVGGGGTSVLSPVDRTVALRALVAQSPGILAEDGAASGQLEVLAALLRQAAPIDVRLGSDVFDRPAELARTLSGVATADAWDASSSS